MGSLLSLISVLMDKRVVENWSISEVEGVRRIVFSMHVFPLPIIIAAFENRSCPFSNQFLRLSFDSQLWPFALRVKQRDFPDPASNQGFLADWELGQDCEHFSLDVIRWQTTIVQRFKEESHRP